MRLHIIMTSLTTRKRSTNRKLNEGQASAVAKEQLLPELSLPHAKMIIYQGMMHKKGGLIKTIKNRMFVLTKSWLGYYDMSSGTKLKGSIALTDITKLSVHASKVTIFYLQTKKRKFEFICSDQVHKHKWMNMINGCRWNLYNNRNEAEMNYNSVSTRTLVSNISMLEYGKIYQVLQAVDSILKIVEQSRNTTHPTLCRVICRTIERRTFTEKGKYEQPEVKKKIVQLLEIVSKRDSMNDNSAIIIDEEDSRTASNQNKTRAKSDVGSLMQSASYNLKETRKVGNELKNTEYKFNELYRLTKELGEGAYSVVYQAKNRKTKELVAVKVINKSRLPKEEYLNLTNEVAIMQKLDHPNIVKFIDYFDEKESCFIVTELCSGGELLDHILKHKYSEGNAATVIRIICKALQYCHTNGIVHRDLKPENVLLKDNNSRTENIKLADFGFAKFTSFVGLSTACGSPHYVAPEILNGERYGPSVDMWSLGVIMFIMLSGEPPFFCENETKMFNKIRQCDYKFHPEKWGTVSDNAKDLISKLLIVDFQSRLSPLEVLEHPWINNMEEIGSNLLLDAAENMKKWNARKRLIGGIMKVRAAIRFKKALSGNNNQKKLAKDI